MKIPTYFSHNRTLRIAISISIALHGLLLAVRFAAPEMSKFQPTDTPLEIILVNAKHSTAPVKADALAQANLDGGGNEAKGRAKSPFLNLHKTTHGESVKAAKRRVVELEEKQKKLVAKLMQPTSSTVRLRNDIDKSKEIPTPDRADLLDSAEAIARKEAEIAKNIVDYNKRPKKTQVTPSTREVGQALYYKALQDRIEKVGTLNFPQDGKGQKIYGELVVYIPVFHDGSIYDKEGGVRIERGSGNSILDRAALNIIRRAAPFGRFPPNMRSKDKDDVWEIITKFKFSQDDQLMVD